MTGEDTQIPKTILIHNKIMPYREPVFELLVERADIEILLFEGSIPNSFKYPGAVSKVSKPELISRLWQDDYEVIVTPDVVYSDAHLSYLVAKFRNKGIVQWTESWAIPTRTIKERFRTNLLLRIAGSFADEFVVPGQASAEYVQQVTGTESNSIHHVGAVTNIGHSVTDNEKKPGLLKSDDDVPTVLFLGQVIRRKGVDTLIDAVAKIQDQNNCRLLIGGSGDEDYISRLKEQVAEYDLDNTTFLGWVPENELFAYYMSADVYVLPSRADPWGISVVEAMKAGTPVIVSEAVGAAWDLVDNRDTGFIIPVDNSDFLADRLQVLLNNPTKRAKMGKCASELIAKEMTTKRMVDGIETAIRRSSSSAEASELRSKYVLDDTK